MIVRSRCMWLAKASPLSQASLGLCADANILAGMAAHAGKAQPSLQGRSVQLLRPQRSAWTDGGRWMARSMPHQGLISPCWSSPPPPFSSTSLRPPDLIRYCMVCRLCVDPGMAMSDAQAVLVGKSIKPGLCIQSRACIQPGANSSRSQASARIRN